VSEALTSSTVAPPPVADNDRIQIAVRVNGEDFWTSQWMSREEFLAWMRPPDHGMVVKVGDAILALLLGKPAPTS